MHVPVMLEDVLEVLAVKNGGVYIDATAGGGGHAEAIASRALPAGRLLCLDRDPEAVERTAARLAGYGGGCVVARGNFGRLADIARQHGFDAVDGILFDLGMSSWQVDTPERGFSFSRDGPLDMRMDRSGGPTAADLVNGEAEEVLSRLFHELGEERQARRVARAIVARRADRPFAATGDLAGVVVQAKGGRRGARIHPATRVFQALRMAVNREQESLGDGLEAAFDVIGRGGRIAAISFHSLEDRLVKQAFTAHVGRWESLPQGGRAWAGRRPAARYVRGRKPARPTAAEAEGNPRSRSARLRAVERTD